MSSKPLSRQRIVPAIPHQLAVRRAKVVPPGKSDHQLPAADKGKNEQQLPAADKGKKEQQFSTADKEQPISTPLPVQHKQLNGTGQDAHNNNNKDDAVIVADEPKDKFEQAPAGKNESVHDKKPIDKENGTAAESKDKDTNGLPAPAVAVPAPRRQHHQDAQARPFIPKHQAKRSEHLVFGGHQDSSSLSPAHLSSAFGPPPGMPAPMAPYAPVHMPAPVAAMGHAPGLNGHASAHTNGHFGSISSSPSHTPSLVPGADSSVTTPEPQLQHKPHAQHMPFSMPPFDSNVQHLADFVLSQWGVAEFADYILEMYSTNQSTKPLMLPVHGLIVARCPNLLKLINSLPQSRTHSRAMVVHFPRSYYFQDANAFADALRFIYGGSLIDPTYLFNNPVSTSDSRMRYALSYLASGHCLNVESIVVHAYNIALRLISFSELEVVLFFAASGNCLREQCLYGPYADQIVWQALYFIVTNIYPEFVLDTSASELSSLPRLPSTSTSGSGPESRPDSRSSSSVFANSDAPAQQNPITTIRFGSATPSSSSNDPLSPTYILSSVLLSLPFELLKTVLEHEQLLRSLGLDAILSIAGDVVRERERRRAEACSSLQDQKKSLDGILLMGESVGRDVTGTRLKLLSTRYS